MLKTDGQRGGNADGGAEADQEPEELEGEWEDPLEYAECCVEDDWEWWGHDAVDDDDAFHPQALARWGDRSAMVDVEMAPLVTELWRAGVETYSSCQDLGESLADLAIQFPHMADRVAGYRGLAVLDLCPPDAQPVLDMIAAGGPLGSVYDRMTRWTAEGAWQYGLLMLDLPADAGDYGFRILGIQVIFPRSDIPAVTEALRGQLAKLDRAERAAERR